MLVLIWTWRVGATEITFKFIEQGLVTEEMINKSVERILKIKYRLGLFEDPYRYSSIQRETDGVYNEGNLAVSEDMARESIVLLKNENDILPIKAQNKKIAVIGPFANDKDVPLGTWRARQRITLQFHY